MREKCVLVVFGVQRCEDRTDHSMHDLDPLQHSGDPHPARGSLESSPETRWFHWWRRLPLARHLEHDGVGALLPWLRRMVARPLLAALTRNSFAPTFTARRDPGERAAERFFRALGYTVLARNWRSPRDRKDEADLIVRTPDGSEVVIVEVKRAAGPWDPLQRVDARKREVLWRILTDVEGLRGADQPRERVEWERSESEREHLPRARSALPDARRLSQPLQTALRRAQRVRVDLVAVRGEGRSASVVEHAHGIFLREFERGRYRQ